MSDESKGIATETSLCLPFPMREGRFMAQIVIPRDMTWEEADRLSAFVQSLAQTSRPPPMTWETTDQWFERMEARKWGLPDLEAKLKETP